MTELISRPAMVKGFNLNLPEDSVVKYLQMAFSIRVRETGKTIRNSPGLQDAFKKAAHWLVAPDRIGLKILGSPGTGKSTLVKAMQDVINQYIMSQSGCRFGLIIQPALLIVDRCLRGDPEMSITKMIERPALAIDDLGLEPLAVKYYGSELMPIRDIIHQRINNDAPTIIVTNLNEDDIQKKYGERFRDRLKDMTTIILNGDSNRSNK